MREGVECVTGCLVLQRLPAISCFTMAVAVCYVIYALLGPGTAFQPTLPPQAVIVSLCASGIAACLLATLLVPAIMKTSERTAPANTQITRMNLLGLVRVSCGMIDSEGILQSNLYGRQQPFG